MDDLKIVFYVAVAIGWVVYNNLRKIRQETQKRDYTKPPPDIIIENWPGERPVIRKPEPLPRPQPRPVTIEKKEPLKREVLVKKEQQRHSKTERTAIRHQTEKIQTEGGSIRPSKVVQFEEPVGISENENLLVYEIRNTDFRQAIILSEILKRPYY